MAADTNSDRNHRIRVLIPKGLHSFTKFKLETFSWREYVPIKRLRIGRRNVLSFWKEIEIEVRDTFQHFASL